MTTAANPPPVERVYPPKLMFMVVNPIMRWVMATGMAARIQGLVRLDFRGRRTGNDYKIVTAVHNIDGQTVALTNSGWRHNFAAGHPVTVIKRGKSVQMTGTLEADPDKVADIYADRIEEMGVGDAARRLGIKINVDREPTHEELVALAKKEGLSVIYFEPAS